MTGWSPPMLGAPGGLAVERGHEITVGDIIHFGSCGGGDLAGRVIGLDDDLPGDRAIEINLCLEGRHLAVVTIVVGVDDVLAVEATIERA